MVCDARRRYSLRENCVANKSAVIATAFAGNPPSINFAIFVAVFSWLVVLYGLVAAFVTSLAIPVVMMALDGIAILLTFIAGVVLAARLGVHSCSNSVSHKAGFKEAIESFANGIFRPTPILTASPMARATLQAVAASSKLARRSSGSSSPHILLLSP